MRSQRAGACLCKSGSPGLSRDGKAANLQRQRAFAPASGLGHAPFEGDVPAHGSAPDVSDGGLHLPIIDEGIHRRLAADGQDESAVLLDYPPRGANLSSLRREPVGADRATPHHAWERGTNENPTD